MKLLKFLVITFIAVNLTHAQEACHNNYSDYEIPQLRQFTGHVQKIDYFLNKKGFWGNYYVKQICGSTYVGIPQNNYIPLNATFLKPENIVEFKITPEGNGSINSNRSCLSTIQEYKTNNQVPFKKKLTIFSVFSVGNYFHKAFKTIKEHSNCKNDSFTQRAINVNKTGSIFPWSNQIMSLPKNVGYLNSKKKDSKKADLECKKLNNTTYINIGNHRACIGYINNDINEVKIITHDPSSPYITRVILRQKHNFNRGPVEECPVAKN